MTYIIYQQKHLEVSLMTGIGIMAAWDKQFKELFLLIGCFGFIITFKRRK